MVERLNGDLRNYNYVNLYKRVEIFPNPLKIKAIFIGTSDVPTNRSTLIVQATPHKFENGLVRALAINFYFLCVEKFTYPMAAIQQRIRLTDFVAFTQRVGKKYFLF